MKGEKNIFTWKYNTITLISKWGMADLVKAMSYSAFDSQQNSKN